MFTGRWCRYLLTAKYDSIVSAATENLCGMHQASDRVIVAGVESTELAMRGGLQPGEVFVEINGVRFNDGRETPNKLALLVCGQQGSRVGVVMEHKGKTLDFILTREPIKIASVRG